MSADRSLPKLPSAGRCVKGVPRGRRPRATLKYAIWRPGGHVLKRVGELGKRRFAVIVDEAHSSQTGDAARDLKLALGALAGEALAAAKAVKASRTPAGSEADGESEGRPCRRRRSPGASAEPVVLRFHGDPQGPHPRALRPEGR